jgi:phosphate:Na+ symporter
MAILNLLAAFALLLWGSRQMHRAARELAAGWMGPAARHALRGRYFAFGAGLAGGLLQPAARNRVLWTASLAEGTALPLAAAYAVVLGANLGGALAMLVFAEMPAWAFQALAVSGAAAALLTKHARVQLAGRALFGAGLLLLALQILAVAAASADQGPLGDAIAAGLQGDALLALTAGTLLALCLRSVFVAVLVVAMTAGSWLTPPAALAVLLGIQVGGAILGFAAGGFAAYAQRLGAGHLLATLLAAAAGLLLLGDVSQLLPGTGARELLVLHAGFHGLVAAAFLNLAGPLARAMERWLPERRPQAGAPGGAFARLQVRELQTPSVALASAVREVMRVADLVDAMLRTTKDAFLRGDAASVRATREAEEQVDQLYLALKRYLTQMARGPLSADEHRRWEELMAFLIVAEQLADGIERTLLDLETKKIAPQLAYPARAEGEILALHEKLAQNLRLAASLCLERRTAAAASLAGADEVFASMERAFRAAHVARLVAGDAPSIAISALHLDLMADLGQMNAPLCAFARLFLELRETPRGPSSSPGELVMKTIVRGTPQGRP